LGLKSDCTLCRSPRNSPTATSPRLLVSVMRLPILLLAHIATAHRVDFNLTATTGEGSNTSSIAATALQSSTAVVATHGSDRGVQSRAGLGIPRRLVQRFGLILAASRVPGTTAFVVPGVPGVRRDALSGSGFPPAALKAEGPGSIIPGPSGRGKEEKERKIWQTPSTSTRPGPFVTMPGLGPAYGLLDFGPDREATSRLWTRIQTAWLWTRIQEAKAAMVALGAPGGSVELYGRAWYPKPPQATPQARATRFVVMQFNCLAHGLSAPAEDVWGEDVPPLPATMKKDGGGFIAVPEQDICFAWRYRSWRLIEEILRHGPDLVALEEVDHFHDFFLPAMKAAGFEGVWIPKTKSPCSRFGYTPDGTAVFWRSATFAPLTDSSVVMSSFKEEDGTPSKQVYAMVDLQHRASKETVRLVATHLKAKAGEKNERLRHLHVGQLLEAIYTEPRPAHTVVCGDFNTNPYDDVNDKHQASAVPRLLTTSTLRSAYRLPLSPKDCVHMYSTWKLRGADDAPQCVDYIFHSPGLRPTSLLTPPNAKDLDAARLPGFRYPSDHIALAAEFEMTTLTRPYIDSV